MFLKARYCSARIRQGAKAYVRSERETSNLLNTTAALDVTSRTCGRAVESTHGCILTLSLTPAYRHLFQ